MSARQLVSASSRRRRLTLEASLERGIVVKLVRKDRFLLKEALVCARGFHRGLVSGLGMRTRVSGLTSRRLLEHTHMYRWLPHGHLELAEGVPRVVPSGSSGVPIAAEATMGIAPTTAERLPSLG